ncbi:MAG TPA: aldehyde dehydrogenase family protein, partial [Flavisolibacter sp.]|nr:aldehyde dehydrogenase family protein [Flavisolibacter sp.]
MKIINPATEALIMEINEDSNSILEEKFRILKTGQKSWSHIPLEERIGVLARFASLLEKNKEHLAAILTSEVGKPLQQSHNEISGACTRIKWLTENATKYLSEEWMVTSQNPEEKIVHEPLGVICNISAWNYPYLVGVNVYVPALIAGNAVFYKPSEYATLTGLEV